MKDNTKTKPLITLIAAMGLDRTIGLDNKMPWHLPEDLRHFKARTLGKTMIMGRNTYESIGKPLPGRNTIIISRSLTSPPHSDCLLASSLNEAIQKAQALAAEKQTLAGKIEEQEIMVVGGGQIYTLALPFAHRMVITKIHKAFAGDTFFPEWDKNHWTLVYKKSHTQANEPYLDYSFLEYHRT